MSDAFIPLDLIAEVVRQAIHDSCEASQETSHNMIASENNTDPA